VRTPKREVTKQGEVYFTVRYRNPPGGPQRELAFYGDTEADARRDADTFAAVLAASGPEAAVRWWNTHLDDKPGAQGMTLDEWWPKYLEQKTGITQGTRDSCDRIYKRIWKPKLGHLPLTAIERGDVTRVINQLAADGRADKTIANFYGVLTTCLKMALEDGHIAALPTRKIKLPRNTEHETEEMRFLSHDEWADIQAQLRKRGNGHYVALFTFLVGSGARWGEAEALTVGDIFQRRVRLDGGGTVMVWHVRINKAAKWNVSSRHREVGPPKTKKSRRTIPLGPEVMVELAPLLGGRAKTDRLFLAPKGGPLDHAEAWRVWTAVREAAGLDDPQPRIHDLRHTHASWQLDAGVPVHVVSARLGHESIQTTVDIYGHGSVDAHLAAVEAVSMAMRPRLELT
jgi:integrase